MRRSARIPKETPILLIGSDLDGRMFSEPTTTVLLSLHGAGLLSLVCTSCKSLEKIDDTSFEADICATNEAVLRYCKRCASSTLWKPPQSFTNQQPASVKDAQLPLFSPPSTPPPAPIPAPSSSYDPAPAPAGEPQAAILTLSPPAPAAPAVPRINRRKHPRVKVSYAACVRLPGRPDDIVQCEDMSKGGLRFKSTQKYYPQSLIEVAVPYQPGQPAIFVPAQIVFVEELPEQRLFRCGVQYLHPTKPRDPF